MSRLALLGAVIGADNLRVTLGLAAAGLHGGRMLRMLAAFAVVEGVMPLVGLALGLSLVDGSEPMAGLLGSIAMAVCGAMVLATTLGANPGLRAGGRLDTPWLLLGLPFLLGLDNLFAGMSLSALGMPAVPAALTLGLVSAVTSLGGFLLGGLVARAVPRLAPIVGGAALILFAVVNMLDPG